MCPLFISSVHINFCAYYDLTDLLSATRNIDPQTTAAPTKGRTATIHQAIVITNG